MNLQQVRCAVEEWYSVHTAAHGELSLQELETVEEFVEFLLACIRAEARAAPEGAEGRSRGGGR